jgi:hypothetical protein
MSDNEETQLFVARLSGGALREAKFRFEDDDKRDLRELLTEKLSDSRVKEFDEFTCALELAIAQFKTLTELEKVKLPKGKIRDSFKKLKAETFSLMQTLAAMDTPDSRFVLELCLQQSLPLITVPSTAETEPSEEAVLARIQAARARRIDAEELIYDLVRDLKILHNAASVAETIAFDTKRGRPKNFLRLQLATNVANAFRQYLGIKPTTTEDGLFAKVLHIVLNAARVVIEDEHPLAVEAVKQYKATQAQQM